MSQSNLQQFLALAKSDISLREKIEAARTDYVQTLVRLSAEAGVPCTPEDFSGSSGELTDADLEISGGGSFFGTLPEYPPV